MSATLIYNLGLKIRCEAYPKLLEAGHQLANNSLGARIVALVASRIYVKVLRGTFVSSSDGRSLRNSQYKREGSNSYREFWLLHLVLMLKKVLERYGSSP